MHYDAAVIAGFPAYYGNTYGQWASNLSGTGPMTTEPDYRPRDWASQPPYRYPDYKSTALRGPTRNTPPLSTYAIEPPPAPMVSMSTIGTIAW